MDSLMAVEIKQVLERDFGINTSAPELRTLTFGKLQELTDSISRGEKPLKLQKSEMKRKIIFSSLGDEKTANEIIIPLNVADTNQSSDVYALFIPGLEGVISPTQYTLSKSIGIPVHALQYHAHCGLETFSELVPIIAKVIAIYFIYLFFNTNINSMYGCFNQHFRM